MTSKLISIVTPSFNQSDYIKYCIESVKKQSYRPIEHIIVDNCSTDDTDKILKVYKNNPEGIDVILIKEPDKGQSDALNKGFKKATGELIAWLNADDYFLLGAFTKVNHFYSKNPMVDVIYGDYYFVDENGKIMKRRKEMGYDPGILFYVGCYIPSSGTFFHRRIFDEGNFLDINFDITMDYEFFVRLSKAKKKFLHIPEYLSCFRWHHGNKSLNAIKRQQERQRVQQIYGVKLFKKPEWNQKYYNAMFYFYLLKRVSKKLISGCYF
jgi:glycosyltransferase involved in cell wall biosynthesis